MTHSPGLFQSDPPDKAVLPLLILGNGAPDASMAGLTSAPVGSVYLDGANLPSGSENSPSLKWGASLRGDATNISTVIGGVSFSSIISENGTPETQIQGIFDNTIADYTKPKPSDWPLGSVYPPSDTWQGAYFGNIPSFQPSNPGANACFILVVNQSMQGNGQETGLAKISIRKCDPSLMSGDDAAQKRGLETSQNLGYLPNSYSVQEFEIDNYDEKGNLIPASPDVRGYSAIFKNRAYPGGIAMRLPTNSIGGFLDGSQAKLPSKAGAEDGTAGWALPEFIRLNLDKNGNLTQAQISLNRSLTGNPDSYPLNWFNLGTLSSAPFNGQNGVPVTNISNIGWKAQPDAGRDFVSGNAGGFPGFVASTASGNVQVMDSRVAVAGYWGDPNGRKVWAMAMAGGGTGLGPFHFLNLRASNKAGDLENGSDTSFYKVPTLDASNSSNLPVGVNYLYSGDNQAETNLKSPLYKTGVQLGRGSSAYVDYIASYSIEPPNSTANISKELEHQFLIRSSTGATPFTPHSLVFTSSGKLLIDTKQLNVSAEEKSRFQKIASTGKFPTFVKAYLDKNLVSTSQVNLTETASQLDALQQKYDALEKRLAVLEKSAKN
ncbi:hypothetical protein FAI41_04745 [Acetobacteraceae bacterium]|nr:hypothetical protein FAI41_04745 [Acetobacteraceae bacterium]